MMHERMKVADLNEEQLAKVQAMEAELGTLLVALEPPHQLARLNREQLARLQELEDAMGVVLLAYQKQ